MNLRKQQAHITELYRRGDFDAAREGFEQLITLLEETDEIELLDYWEALLGLGSLHQKDLHDLAAAETCWRKLVALVFDLDDSLSLDPDFFDVYTQGLLLLAFVQRDQGKTPEAEANLQLLRSIAVETRGETSADVKSIDGHLATLRRRP